MPLRFDAAILSRMRSPVTSRSNWAVNQHRRLTPSRMEANVRSCRQIHCDGGGIFGTDCDPIQSPIQDIKSTAYAALARGQPSVLIHRRTRLLPCNAGWLRSPRRINWPVGTTRSAVVWSRLRCGEFAGPLALRSERSGPCSAMTFLQFLSGWATGPRISETRRSC